MLEFENFKITPLEFDYKLSKPYIGKDQKTGEEKQYEKIIGYFPNIPSALKRIREMAIKEEISLNTVDLDNTIKIMEDVNNAFIQYLDSSFIPKMKGE